MRRERHWRDAVRDFWHVAEAPSPEDGIAERDACIEALAAPSDTDREALLLVSWEGLAPSEAAAALSISPNAFNVRLHRARHRLQRQLHAGGDARLRVVANEELS